MKTSKLKHLLLLLLLPTLSRPACSRPNFRIPSLISSDTGKPDFRSRAGQPSGQERYRTSLNRHRSALAQAQQHAHAPGQQQGAVHAQSRLAAAQGTEYGKGQAPAQKQGAPQRRWQRPSPLQRTGAAALEDQDSKTWSASAVTPVAITAQGAVSLVLPLRLHENEHPRALALLGSLVKNVPRRQLVTQLLLVVPAAQLLAFQALAASLHRYGGQGDWGQVLFPIRVVSEDVLLHHHQSHLADLSPQTAQREGRGEGRGMGYRVQMLAKLAAAFLVDTPFYITLDADVLLSRELRMEELVRGGRGLMLQDGANNRLAWHRGAAAALNTTLFPLWGGVTPALLCTAASRALLHHLHTLHPGRTWDATLFQALDESGNDWTEYALYWQYVQHRGLLDVLHFQPTSPMDPTLYDPKQISRKGYAWFKPEHLFSSDSTREIFTIVQGIGGSAPEWVLESMSGVLAREDRSP